jgi:DNA mismatch repair protein MutS2
LNQHALKVLEYYSLIDHLAQYTDSEVTRQIILELQPSKDYQTVLCLAQELDEYRRLMLSGYSIPGFSGPVISLNESFKSAKKKGWRLLPENIAAIGDLLHQSDLIKRGFDQIERIPLIKKKTNHISLLPELKNRIIKSVNSNGEILDHASDNLARIRQSIRKHLDRMRSRMEEMALSMHKKGYLQDPVVTFRQGRYVLPVRSGSIRNIPGIVHDKSASGATFFIEPKVSVADSNALNKLEAEERQEVNLVLKNLTAEIGLKSDLLSENFRIVVEMDFLRAKARFCNEIKANFIPIQSEPRIDLKDCKNPTLVLHRLNTLDQNERVKPVVPIDIQLDDSDRILVITGPNTGGKTVALKTVGITVLMVQSGLHPVCSEFSHIGIFKKIFADIGDEQSIQQSLSTFSSHIKHIVTILQQADEQSLALLDELGAGTDPEEGSALGITIINQLLKKKVFSVVNTHHNSIKAFAFTTDGVQNAAMEFDVNSLQPTYRILQGRIGQSNALHIAEKLGFPKSLIQEVHQYYSGKTHDLQKMLDVVEQRRMDAERRIAQTKSEKIRVKELRRAREDVLQNANIEAGRIIKKAVNDAQQILSELYREQDILKKEAKRVKKSLKLVQVEKPLYNKKYTGLESKIADLSDSIQPEIPESANSDDISKGDIVKLRRFGGEARVLQKESDNRYLVDMNGKKIRVTADDVLLLKKSEKSDMKSFSDTQKLSGINYDYSDSNPPSLRLNLIGRTTDEAQDELERYMDRVIRHNIPFVTIIHGFGTGKLQNAVMSYLKTVPRVLRARRGESSEGGGGVTIVELDTN